MSFWKALVEEKSGQPPMEVNGARYMSRKCFAAYSRCLALKQRLCEEVPGALSTSHAAPSDPTTPGRAGVTTPHMIASKSPSVTVRKRLLYTL